MIRARKKAETRHEDYEVLIGAFRDVAGHCKRLEVSRDDLNKKIRDAQGVGRQFLVSTLLAVFGILLTILLGWPTLAPIVGH